MTITRYPDDRITVHRIGSGHSALRGADRRDDALLLVHVARGRVVVDTAAGTVLLADGDLVVLRETDSLAVTSELAGAAAALRITRAAAGPYFDPIDGARDRVIGIGDGSASIVAHLLDGIAWQTTDRAASYEGRLARHLAGLVAVVCADLGGRGGRDDLLQRAKDYIELHLSDVDLAPRRIAAAQNMSTRTLHRLFEADRLTLGGWIRARRLEQCRVDLIASDRDVPIGVIATRWGMWDAARFSRLFKAAYGMSPRAYRATVSAAASVVADASAS